MKFIYAPGATPLDPDEAEGLIPGHITTQAQLNEWEQLNILETEQWVTGRQFDTPNVLCIQFLKALHNRMFCNTWRWAAQFRQSDKNIGVAWPQVASDLQVLLDDVTYQIEHQTYTPDDIAARFHHRLVAIHPFANGNGRHARLSADILLLSLEEKRFTWGSTQTLTDMSPIRKQYIDALRKADRGDYTALLAFVRL